MAANRLLIETQEILEDARQLLDYLPPLSPDHENVRMAVVKLRRARSSLTDQREIASKALVHSLETIDEAKRVVAAVRQSVNKRTRRHAAPALKLDPTEQGRSSSASTNGGGVTVFLDMDTVLLTTHQGRYGPELGLQADISDSIGRLFEFAGEPAVGQRREQTRQWSPGCGAT